MTRLIVFATVVLLASAGVDAGTQRRPDIRIDPKLTEQLKNDLAIAIAHATLSDVQQRTLRTAEETLRTASDARRGGRTVDRGAVKQAFADLKSIVDSDALRPEDAKRVTADLEALRKAMRDQVKREMRRRRPAPVA